MEFLALLKQLNWVDYAILGVIVVSVIVSVIRGFMREALSLISWVLALWVALSFADDLAVQLNNVIAQPQIRLAVAFVMLFVITLFIGGLFNFIFGGLVQRSGLTGTDRSLGMVFGFARGGLVVALLLLIGSLSALSDSEWWKSSALIPYFKPFAVWLKSFLQESLSVKL